MTPEDYLKSGNLEESLRLLQDKVKKEPSNAQLRIFLFQLFAVMGQWERALTQLNVVKELDESAIAMVLTYRQVIACEQFRERVFEGVADPTVLGEPQQWIALLIRALHLAADKNYGASQELRDQAFEAAPIIGGTINSDNFEWLADGDSRLGPIFEVIIDGRYLWTTLQNIQSVTIEEPVDLRDIIWLPAYFRWKNGGESYGLIPARYPNSYQIDSQLALSRKTIWQEYPQDLNIGYGQKMWITNQSEYPLLETRVISIASNEPMC